MAYLYESIQRGVFNFLVPCLDKTIKMFEGDQVKLLYKLEGSGYKYVLKFLGEIPDDSECLDNYCQPVDYRDYRIDVTDLESYGIDVEEIITTTVSNMQADIQAQIQTDIQDNIDEIVDNASSINIKNSVDVILPQVNGDIHYDSGYDFFADDIFNENITQDIADYYSFFYIEVPTTDSFGYLRTISTNEGDKHVRPAIGSDNYVYNSETKKVVNYSKIIMPFEIKAVIELKFENNDVVDRGFELQDDKQTILIYGDPEGFFINKKVKVRYII